ncbi:MAG TPA: 5-oxoprolinase/urea amidolyase family protein [Ottowia sp.]|uniref:5-oxoprolinase subunit B/C family protein n=1 Tax=Ottowia sp. TaxID=1898956 RepID=UPI002CD67191|nr:5-oxoprolinase/urea amidolyase family protein [Ottowia sp.]HMN21770.1 5-oxoprolinase/urea amidolyase family protein [Ottowia sp.]
MRFLPASDCALLVELADLDHALALYRAVQERPIPGVHELVPAARTLLVHYRPEAVAPAALIAALRERSAVADRGPSDRAATRQVEIPVHYRGEDLAEVAELLGIPVAELIARHTGQPWQAAFAGFAPGFVYLAGGHPCFRGIPRRPTPRTRLPAGSVALAGDFSAVYPAASPGGWQLIGVTDVPMWDLRRTEPAYVQPGFQVQFVDADAGGRHVSLPPTVASEPDPAPEPTATTAIEFERVGLQTLVQDAGRHGMAGLGISPSGALDQPAMRQANRLVGNPVHTPVLENLLGGLRLRCHGRATLAVTGAAVPLTLHGADGRQWALASHAAVALDDGDVLVVGTPTAGVRCYVAVRGGWQVAPVLGSCATDTLAHVGPPALQAGQRIAIGSVPPHALRATQPAEAAPADLPRPGDEVTLDVVAGPRTDWFTPDALARLERQTWQVTPQSNRIGLRLHGAQPLTRARHDELPSEGTVTGAIQVPAGGQPVLFLADHPLTGGYPVIAAVASHHLPLAAQLPVGCRLRFRVIAPFADLGAPAKETPA